jgi:hypothetical protein
VPAGDFQAPAHCPASNDGEAVDLQAAVDPTDFLSLRDLEMEGSGRVELLTYYPRSNLIDESSHSSDKSILVCLPYQDDCCCCVESSEQDSSDDQNQYPLAGLVGVRVVRKRKASRKPDGDDEQQDDQNPLAGPSSGRKRKASSSSKLSSESSRPSKRRL